MGWSIGYDDKYGRDIGYGVISYCDHPNCDTVIDRGLSYVCGGEPYGGDRGCGLYFCGKHLYMHTKLPQLCEKCFPRVRKPFIAKADHPEWMAWKLTDKSWHQWRKENPKDVESIILALEKNIK